MDVTVTVTGTVRVIVPSSGQSQGGNLVGQGLSVGTSVVVISMVVVSQLTVVAQLVRTLGFKEDSKAVTTGGVVAVTEVTSPIKARELRKCICVCLLGMSGPRRWMRSEVDETQNVQDMSSLYNQGGLCILARRGEGDLEFSWA